MGFRRNFGIALYQWACDYLPELDKARFDEPMAIAQPVAVEQTERRPLPGVMTADKTPTWSPHQSGSVIVAEPDLVRADRLRREREGK